MGNYVHKNPALVSFQNKLDDLSVTLTLEYQTPNKIDLLLDSSPLILCKSL